MRLADTSGPRVRSDAAHPLQPAPRRPAGRPLVEQGDDLALEEVEQARRLGLVAPAEVVPALGRGDGPAVLAVEELVPPAVEDRAVEDAVEGRLLAAGAARLQRPAGGVQPHVAALEQHAGHGDVVVLEERDPVADVLLAGELDDLADHLLAEVVGRVGLAGEERAAPAGRRRAAAACSRSGWDSSRVARL